jgi:hypothetical protein
MKSYEPKENLLSLIVVVLSGFLGAGCSVFGVRNEEQPPYEVLYKQDNKEIRKYQSYVVARTTVEGSFEEAQSKGFKILAGYIFGKNKSQKKIAMTAPVVQSPEYNNEKIAMTAPVVMSPNQNGQDSGVGSWTMTFSMPSQYSIETLPVPEDGRIALEKVPSKYIAAYMFSGFWNESKNQKLGSSLLDWLEKEKQYEPESKPMFAGYDPPWTLPFFRRNEMLVEIKPLTSKTN